MDYTLYKRNQYREKNSQGIHNKSRQIYNYTIDNSPLKKPLSLEDIGKSSVYLMSDLSKGVTGEILYVDNGYNNVGMSIQDL